MNGRGFRLGKIQGIELKIHYSWLVVFWLLSWVFALRFYSVVLDVAAVAAVVMGVVTVLFFFASVVAHEFAHALVARRYGLEVQRITLFMLGGVAEINQEPPTPRAEFLMAAAGPVASYIAAGLFGGLGALGGWVFSNEYILAVGVTLAIANAAVATFNLLPGYPLDGGRVFKAIVWRLTGNVDTAMRIASYGGRVVGVLLAVLGGAQILTGIFVSGVWLIVLGWFLATAAKFSYLQSVFLRRYKNVTVRQIMDPTPTDSAQSAQLTPDDTIATALMRMQQGHASRLYVGKNRQIIGVVTIERLRQLLGTVA